MGCATTEAGWKNVNVLVSWAAPVFVFKRGTTEERSIPCHTVNLQDILDIIQALYSLVDVLYLKDALTAGGGARDNMTLPLASQQQVPAYR